MTSRAGAGAGTRSRGLRRTGATVLSVLALVVGASALAAAAPAGAAPATKAGAAGRCGASAVPGDQTIVVDGAAVPVYLPAGYTGGRLPLVLDLHGSGSTGLGEMAGDGIRAVADREGFAVAAPNGAVPFNPLPSISGFAWNIEGVPLVGTTVYPPAGTRDEVAFLSHVIDGVSAHACIDARRVYATGISGGGRMASQLACDLSDRIAAVAPVAGVRYPQASDTPPRTVDCEPGRAVPVIAIHGAWDPVNVLADTPPPEAATLPAAIRPPVPGSSWSYSAVEAVERWAESNGCKPEPRITAVTPNIDRWDYRACHANADVVLYLVKDSGHASPGHPSPGLEFLLNPTNTEVDGTAVAWEFLSQHRLKPT